MNIKEQMQAALKAARDIAAKAEAENREMSDAEVTEAAEHLRKYQALKADHAKATKADKLKQDLADIGADLGLEFSDGQKQPPASFTAASKRKSLGQMFVDSQEYKGLMAQFGSGRINEKSRVQSAPFGVKSLVTGGSDTSGGAFVQNDVTGLYEPLGRDPLTVRDLVSVRQTESDTVEYVRQTLAPTSAAPVAEATDAGTPVANTTTGVLEPVSGGGYKPEGSFGFQKVTESVKTIAEWVPATKRSLSDASQLRGLIDDELKADLAEQEEEQILNGDGTGENFTGIFSVSGVQTQAYSATVTGLDPLLETTLKAQTKVRTVGRTVPTAYVLNPLDWEAIQLARLAKNPANEGQGGSVPTLHGLPVVLSQGLAVGVGAVANWKKAVLWDREQASITATDSHADFFIRNLVAILAEERLAFGVTRPSAFVEIDLAA